ncbi:MAG: alpha/beta hydrolase [Micropepsaceae bacterium]
MAKTFCIALIVLSTLLLSGCVAPNDFDTGSAIRAVQTPAADLATPKKVFFATTRCRDAPGTGTPGSSAELISQRCWDVAKDNEEMVRLGFGMSEAREVTCGSTTVIVMPAGADPSAKTSVDTPTSFGCTDDFSALRQAVLSTPCRCALVTVTGYNTTFAFGIKRTAQMALDLSYPGIPILFSFAAGGRFGDYVNDTEAAELAAPALHRLLLALSQENSSGTPAIDIIAHSMGTRLTLRAINEGEAPALRYVVLAAPDIDTVAFLQLAGKASARTQRMTVYTSKFDVAMSASTKTHNGRARTGEGMTASVAAGLTRTEIIDATARASDPYAHSYFAESRVMVDDIRAALAGKPATERGRLICNPAEVQSVVACTMPCPEGAKCGPSFYARVVHWLLD